jgi:hypothetical protein
MFNAHVVDWYRTSTEWIDKLGEFNYRAETKSDLIAGLHLSGCR